MVSGIVCEDSEAIAGDIDDSEVRESDYMKSTLRWKSSRTWRQWGRGWAVSRRLQTCTGMRCASGSCVSSHLNDELLGHVHLEASWQS